MRLTSKLISTLFNPILMPLAGALLYFFISPRFTPERTKKLILLGILVINVIIPYLFYLLLRNLGWITHRDLSNLSERKIPLYLCIMVTCITLIKITPSEISFELYYFFLGVLGTLISCQILVYLYFKASMHMMAIWGLTTFVIGLSIHYHINITPLIAILILCVGAIATSRMYLKCHTTEEIIIGSVIGIVPQFILFGFWV
ncbi:hypothetical protein [Galbibacter sp.]|uniref:hypothetical protein n=1 Tax=Galbibacter sp. TaxID=2918471 RepID=UPI002D1FB03C|nr:hypothetical protein [Galbibacter sp.]